MPSCQIYLYQEQKDFLIKYIRERRSDSLILLWSTGIVLAVSAVILLSAVMIYGGEFLFSELSLDLLYIMFFSGAVFVKTFADGFGKTFGFGCDKKCIENDWYSLSVAKFGIRDKNPLNKHPYYMSDIVGDRYICPRYLDWRNATEDTMFVYIKLENGRNYAIPEGDSQWKKYF